MSSLPPAGKRPRADAESTTTLGIGEQFSKRTAERRRGPGDRRHIQSERRAGAADRRAEPAEVQLQTAGEPEPVHLADVRGSIQPNPKAPVTGVADSERLSQAAQTGVPASGVSTRKYRDNDPRREYTQMFAQRRFFQRRRPDRKLPAGQEERRKLTDRRHES